MPTTPSESRSTGTHWSPLEIGLLAAVLIAHVIMAWLIREPGITYRDDDALYLLLSRSLLKLQYLNSHLVETTPHTQYPPGYPLALALVSRVAGERLDAFLALGTLCSAVGLAFLYSLVRRHADSWLALAVAIPVAVNAVMLRMAGSLLAESVFLCLTMLTLWLVDREAGRPKWLGWAIAAGVAATMMRSIGIAVLAGLVAHLLLRRRFRAALTVTLVSAATTGVWLLHTILVPVALHPSGRSYVRAATNIPGESLLSHIKVFAYRYRIHDLPDVLIWPGMDTPEGHYALGTFLALVCLVGLCVMWRRWRPSVLYVAAYLAILLVWPVRSSRFLYGVIPLLILAVMVAVESLTRGKRLVRGIALGLSSVGLVACGLVGWAADWRELRGCDRSHPLDRPGCFTEDARTFYIAARALASPALSPGGALAVHDPMVAYYSGRKSANILPAIEGDSATLLQDLRARDIRYIVFGRTRGSELRSLAPVVAQWCRRLELVIWVPPRALVYRIRDPEEPDDPGASCYSITAYLADPARVPLQRK
jgi:MFS family permease